MATTPMPRLIKSEEKSTDVFVGRAANYQYQMLFQLPNEVSARLSGWGKMTANQLGDDVWEIVPSNAKGASELKSVRGLAGLSLRVWHDAEPERTFGMSRAEYLFVDGQLLVSVARSERKPVNPVRSEQAKKIKAARREARLRDLSIEPTARATSPTVEQDMRDVLEMLRRIESETPYRLDKHNGRWVFVAPVIR